MPPKKKDEQKKQHSILGRVGTNLRLAIVGLPNVGKSTFFNILTKSSAPAENFPFCTIDPNESRVPVPDERFDWLVSHYQPVNSVPAYLNVTDIAGLVKGAHAGEGLGNEFLANIKACDGIFHMIRAFSEDTIVHIDGEVNPIRDMDTIQEELILKDIAVSEKILADVEKKAMRSKDPAMKLEAETIVKVREMLTEKRKPVRFADWGDKEVDILNKHLFLTAKPVIYLINMSEHDYIRKKNKWLSPIKHWLDENDPDGLAIPFSAEYEAKLLDQTTSGLADEKACSALSKIIISGYKVLNLIYFFTAGKDEVKCWIIQKGTKAPQAAGRIHTDFEKGFIMAEVMKFSDLKELGTEAEVKSAGKYRSQGKAYVVEDGDVIFFKFNAGAGLTQSKK